MEKAGPQDLPIRHWEAAALKNKEPMKLWSVGGGTFDARLAFSPSHRCNFHQHIHQPEINKSSYRTDSGFLWEPMQPCMKKSEPTNRFYTGGLSATHGKSGSCILDIFSHLQKADSRS